MSNPNEPPAGSDQFLADAQAAVHDAVTEAEAAGLSVAELVKQAVHALAQQVARYSARPAPAATAEAEAATEEGEAT